MRAATVHSQPYRVAIVQQVNYARLMATARSKLASAVPLGSCPARRCTVWWWRTAVV